MTISVFNRVENTVNPFPNEEISCFSKLRRN